MKKEKLIFQGKLIKVFLRNEVLPNGHKVRLEVINHIGAALIVPFLTKDKVVMIRQYRPVIKSYIYEFPAGTLSPNEAIVSCAKRELIEESGYKGSKFTRLGYIYPAPGYTTERIDIYKAEKLTKVGVATEEDEVIETFVFTRAQVKKLLKSGKIVDAKTIAAISMSGIA